MISRLEKDMFLSLFNRNGYVLDFSTSSFDTFTSNSIGVSLCAKYEMSKGKSLTAYCYEAADQDVIKLFSDLLEHYETFCKSYDDPKKYAGLYERCKRVIEREESSIVSLETPALKFVDRKYISDIAIRANKAIENGEYDSAITKSRTLLEEVFCYAIEARGEKHIQNGRMKELYKQVKVLYSLSHSPELDVRINELLSGLERILTAITEMRNQASDSHGMGDNRIDIDEPQARLFVNAALAMADYILSLVYQTSD